ncbi:MAG: hypothetical protein HY864_08055 [Chloroflexi bacterium]|nr:hypothetical protein [Chloroflexota bacterium]
MNKIALVEELKDAYQLAAQYEGGYSSGFFDAKEFAAALKEAIILFENGDDDTSVKNLWLWFAPTTAWDTFVGSEGIELGNSIFEKLEQYIAENNIKV